MRLLLIRHGLSTFNLESKIQGRNDMSTLTEEGKSQAAKTGEILKEVSIEAIYSSPLQRAKETTNSLLKELEKPIEPIFDNDLLEVDLAPWTGLTTEQVKKKFPKEYQTWKVDPRKLELKRTDNGSFYKPIEELSLQAEKFLKKLLKKHTPQSKQTVIVVAHNAILRSLILELTGLNHKGFRRIKLDNTSISILNIKEHQSKEYQVQIECLNSTVHLNKSLPRKGNSARLILVRHGETDWNLQGRFQGQIDIPLNETGKSQAKKAGNFLSHVLINKAYSSSMIRPTQTATAIIEFQDQIQIEPKKELIEIAHGLWEGKLESEITSSWPDLLKTWKQSPDKVQMPEGENIYEVWERSVKCWEEISKSLTAQDTALVVAHDAVNKTIICHLLGLHPSDIWMIKQGNGGVTVVDISNDPGQPDVVTCLNLTSHLGGILDNTAEGAL